MSNYKNGGLDIKYNITKKDGRPVDPNAKYFVLRLDKDPHALEAIHAYINSVMSDNAELATDLLELVEDIIINQQTEQTGELWKAIDCDYGKEDQSGLYLGDLQMGVSTSLCEALEKWYIANKPNSIGER
jgi:hypothetical protein